MEERRKQISTITVKCGQPLPDYPIILSKNDDGSIVIERPVKFIAIEDGRGNNLSWERRPREDFL